MTKLEIKEINEILFNEYLLAKGLTWNSWHTYPNSIHATPQRVAFFMPMKYLNW